MILAYIESNSAHNCITYIHKEGSVQVATNMGGRTPAQLVAEMRMVYRLNPVKHQVLHFVLSWAPGEHPTLDQLEALSYRIVQDLGFENCPFVTTRHVDNGKDHLHLAVCPIDFDGTRIDRGSIVYRGKHLCRKLEKEYGFIEVPNEKLKPGNVPPEPEVGLQHAHLKPAIYAVVIQSLERVKGGTIGNLAQDLLLHGVLMETQFTGASGDKPNGLGFRLTGEQGGYLKASEVHNSFSLAKLQSKHGLSYDPGQDNQYLVSASKKPLPPVQAVVKALSAPAAPSLRVQTSASVILRKLITTYKSRVIYVRQNTCSETPVSHSAQKRGPRRPLLTSFVPLLAALLSTRPAKHSEPAEGRPEGPLRPMVPSGKALATPGVSNTAPTLGTGLPQPTCRLEDAKPNRTEQGSRAVAPWDAPWTDVDLSCPDPRGRGGPTGLQPGAANAPAGQAASSARMPSTLGDPSGGGLGGRERSPGPGTDGPLVQDATGGPDSPSGPPSASGARTRKPCMGRERGPGGPCGDSPQRRIVEAMTKMAEPLRAILDSLQLRLPPSQFQPRPTRDIAADAKAFTALMHARITAKCESRPAPKLLTPPPFASSHKPRMRR